MAGSSGVVGYDAFLNHSSGGGGGSFLKSWKDDGSIDVWPHPLAGVAVRWAHSFWHVTKQKEKGGDEVDVVRSYRWICHEREIILRKQRFRGDDIGPKPHGIVGNGSREYPPEVCPICILIELLRDQVRAGRLPWTSPIFEWDLKDDSEIVTVGGFCGLFSRPKNDYSKEQWDQMRKAGIEQKEIFMEAAAARCDYIMRVVSDADPQDGVVIAPVADSLGRRIQKAFKDRIESTKGAFVPSRDPLCMRWKYDEKQDFEKKYDLVPMIEAKPSEEVLEALAGDLPPIEELVTPGNVATLRAQMEQHCVLKNLPWDQVFGPAEAAEAAAGDSTTGEPWDASREAAKTQKAQAQVPAAAPPPAAQAPAPPPPAAAAAPMEEPYECEVCAGANSSEVRCRHCGAEYDSFTGALTYNPKVAVGPGNQPRVASTAQAPAQAAPAAETPPPAGRSPARRRRGQASA